MTELFELPMGMLDADDWRDRHEEQEVAVARLDDGTEYRWTRGMKQRVLRRKGVVV